MRYYFHIHVTNGESAIDDIGADFPSEAAAVNEARELAREMMQDAILEGMSIDERVEVTDANGKSVVRVDGRLELEEK